MKSQKTKTIKKRLVKLTTQQISTTNRNMINHRHPGEGRDPGATISVKLTSAGATEQRENQQKIYSICYQGDENNHNQKLNGEIG